MADEATEEVSLLFSCFQVLWLHSDDSLEQALKIRAFLSTLFGKNEPGQVKLLWSLSKECYSQAFAFEIIGPIDGYRESLGWPQALGYVC